VLQLELPKVCVVDNGACRTAWFSLTESTVFVWLFLVGGKMTKKAVHGTVNAATNLGGGIRRKMSNPKLDFDQEELLQFDAQFDDEGYNDYYE
jgi:hypothetical protein